MKRFYEVCFYPESERFRSQGYVSMETLPSACISAVVRIASMKLGRRRTVDFFCPNANGLKSIKT